MINAPEVNPFDPPTDRPAAAQLHHGRRPVSRSFAAAAVAGTAGWAIAVSVYALCVVAFGDIAPGRFAIQAFAVFLLAMGLLTGAQFEWRSGICLVCGLSGLCFCVLWLASVIFFELKLTRHTLHRHVDEMTVWAIGLSILASVAVGVASRWRSHHRQTAD